MKEKAFRCRKVAQHPPRAPLPVQGWPRRALCAPAPRGLPACEAGSLALCPPHSAAAALWPRPSLRGDGVPSCLISEPFLLIIKLLLEACGEAECPPERVTRCTCTLQALRPCARDERYVIRIPTFLAETLVLTRITPSCSRSVPQPAPTSPHILHTCTAPRTR